MKLSLSRPIIFFDIEATGLNVATDRIVELCYIKLYPDGTETVKTQRFNPERHISEEASAVNGIHDEDVANCPHFKEHAAELAQTFQGSDLAGFNSNHFDIPLLVEEFIRAGVDYDVTDAKFVDVQGIFHKMEKRDLTAAYKFYCHKDLNDAHTAEADTRATLEVLEATTRSWLLCMDYARRLHAKYQTDIYAPQIARGVITKDERGRMVITSSPNGSLHKMTP